MILINTFLLYKNSKKKKIISFKEKFLVIDTILKNILLRNNFMKKICVKKPNS